MRSARVAVTGAGTGVDPTALAEWISRTASTSAFSCSCNAAVGQREGQMNFELNPPIDANGLHRRNLSRFQMRSTDETSAPEQAVPYSRYLVAAVRQAARPPR